jgi:hypothetical protein
MNIKQLLGLGSDSKQPLARISRRSFLKGAAATAGATALVTILPSPIAKATAPALPSSPIYIPANHLDYVPRRITTDSLSTITTNDPISIRELQYGETVEMLMMVDTYYPPYGGHLHASDIVRVRSQDAGRWLDYGIAVPTPNSPIGLKPDTSRRAFEAQVRLNGGYPEGYRVSTNYRSLMAGASLRAAYSDEQYFKEFPQARSQQIQATGQTRKQAIRNSMQPWADQLDAEIQAIRERRQERKEGEARETETAFLGYGT